MIHISLRPFIKRRPIRHWSCVYCIMFVSSSLSRFYRLRWHHVTFDTYTHIILNTYACYFTIHCTTRVLRLVSLLFSFSNTTRQTSIVYISFEIEVSFWNPVTLVETYINKVGLMTYFFNSLKLSRVSQVFVIEFNWNVSGSSQKFQMTTHNFVVIK